MTEVVDQSNTGPNQMFQPSHMRGIVGQSFVCGMCGQLTAIEVMINDPVADYKLQVKNSVGTLLAETTVTCALGDMDSPSKIPISSLPILEAGETYKFYLESLHEHTPAMIVHVTDSNAYTNGALLDNLETEGVFYDLNPLDLYFKTYMIPS